MRDLPTDLVTIPPLCAESMDAARHRLDNLTKPPGSLGKLESIAIRLAGITGKARPAPGRKVVLVMAGDHGVVEEGVSAYPSEVTAQMVLNFVRGGAAVNVLARHAGAEVIVTDVGVASEVHGTGYERRNVRRGTVNMCRGPAMTREEAVQSVVTGATLAIEQIDKGATMIATGDMGIGNTTPSTAIFCAVTGMQPASLVGRGTGVDDEGLKRKTRAIETALRTNQPDAHDGLDILHKVGGLEIGAIAGVILGCASRRVPVVVDGFISTAGACLAGLMAPAARDYMIGSHMSAEPGHSAALKAAGLEPLIALDMRLGEGTGAVLAMSLCDAALKVLNEMATFDEAGVSH